MNTAVAFFPWPPGNVRLTFGFPHFAFRTSSTNWEFCERKSAMIGYIFKSDTNNSPTIYRTVCHHKLAFLQESK